MDINQILKDQAYSFTENENGVIRIKNRSLMNGCLAFFSFIVGLLLLFFIAFEPMLIFLALLFLITPFIYSRWRYPRTIIIDTKMKSVTTRKPFSFPERLAFEELEGIEVESDRRDSHTSSYEEGNKDYNYYFFINLKGSKYRPKFLTLRYREPCDELIKKFADYMNEKLSPSK